MFKSEKWRNARPGQKYIDRLFSFLLNTQNNIITNELNENKIRSYLYPKGSQMKSTIIIILAIICILSILLNATIYGVIVKLLNSNNMFGRLLARAYERSFQEKDALDKFYMITGIYLAQEENIFDFGFSLLQELKENTNEKQYKQILNINKWIPPVALLLVFVILAYSKSMSVISSKLKGGLNSDKQIMNLEN